MFLARYFNLVFVVAEVIIFKFLNIMNQIHAKLDIATTDRVIDKLSTIIYSLFTLNDSNLFYASTLYEQISGNLILKDL